jgi:hypothetical protein
MTASAATRASSKTTPANAPRTTNSKTKPAIRKEFTVKSIARISPATVIACIALAIALSGTSYAAFVLPANSVSSKQLKDRSIRTVDIGKRTIAALKGQRGPLGPVGPAGPQGAPGVPGPAGGDLTGNYPNPSITADAVAGPEVANDSLTGSDVAEATLDRVPNADKLDGFDSSSFARSARATVVLDLPAITAHSCINRLITVTALQAADGVLVNPPGNFPVGLVLTPTADVNQDTLQELRVCNVTNAPLDAPNGAYLFTLFRR